MGNQQSDYIIKTAEIIICRIVKKDRNYPDIKGFSDKNLWRMKQFYETYAEDAEKLSPLVRQIAPEAERVFRAVCCYARTSMVADGSII